MLILIKTILYKHFDVESLTIYEIKNAEEKIDSDELFMKRSNEIIRKAKTRDLKR